MSAARWTRGRFSRACAVGPSWKFQARLTSGYVLEPCWGIHKERGAFTLTHLPTGVMVPCPGKRLADVKRFAEELSAETDCSIGRFGAGGLKGVRGARAFRAAVKRRCGVYGFNPVAEFPTGRVAFDAKGKPARLYLPTRGDASHVAR